jgi:ABC-type glutathione transport system ATPase component
MLLRTLVGLAPASARLEGTLTWRDEPARALADPRALAGLRGRGIASIVQQAALSLDPIRSVDRQLDELVQRHRSSRTVAQLLDLVELEPALASARPSELSGGMAQRVSIAAAIACGPALVLADEPTASLDNLVQRRVLETLGRVCDEIGAGLLLVSHDLAVLAERCARVLAIVDGEIAIDAPIDDVLETRVPVIAALVAASRQTQVHE